MTSTTAATATAPAAAPATAAANALRDFTRKWLPRFRDSRQNLHQLLDTGEFRADCAALGYLDDAGEAFDATYPGAFDNLEELDWHLPAVTDASLLGSAVMSKWDQVSHLVSHHFWATDKARCKAAGHEVRLWFILALERLAQLAGENSSALLTCQPTALYLISSLYRARTIAAGSPRAAPLCTSGWSSIKMATAAWSIIIWTNTGAAASHPTPTSPSRRTKPPACSMKRLTGWDAIAATCMNRIAAHGR